MSYLKVFESLQDSDLWTLDGDNMLVEIFDQGEDAREVTRDDGSKVQLVLAASTTGRQLGSFQENKPCLMRVLKVGRGYFNDKGETVALDLKPGAIVEVPKMAVSWRSRVLSIVAVGGDEQIGYVRRESVLQSFPSEEAYRRVCVALKGATT